MFTFSATNSTDSHADAVLACRPALRADSRHGHDHGRAPPSAHPPAHDMQTFHRRVLYVSSICVSLCVYLCVCVPLSVCLCPNSSSAARAPQFDDKKRHPLAKQDTTHCIYCNASADEADPVTARPPALAGAAVAAHRRPPTATSASHQSPAVSRLLPPAPAAYRHTRPFRSTDMPRIDEPTDCLNPPHHHSPAQAAQRSSL